MSLTRALKTAQSRHRWSPPGGATHVLQWLPSALMVPDPGGSGSWEIQPIGQWLAGEPIGDAPEVDEPGPRDLRKLRKFVNAWVGKDTAMTPFEVHIKTEDGATFLAPAYWLIPA